MKIKKQLFPNVTLLTVAATVIFGGMLGAAIYVGVLEGGFGCGGGTVGAMIPVAAAALGYFAGLMNKFADKDNGADKVVEDA